jgi:orotate phosphoribosyltransferase-like protein
MKRQEMIESRRVKVLDLHSKGHTVRAISDSLKIAKSTVQDDITFMRQEAADQISEYVQSLPYEWSKAITSIDRLLEEANRILADKSLDVDQKITVIRTICDLTDKRLAMYSSPQMMQRAVQYVESLKGKLEALERDQRKGANYEIIKEIQPASGKAGIVVRKAVKKQALKKEPEVIV